MQRTFAVAAALTLLWNSSAWAAKPAAKAVAKSTTPQADKPAGQDQKLDAQGLAKAIDQAIDKSLSEEKVKGSPVASDAEFMRRVYLDIAGVIPPVDKVASFLDSKDPQKRAKLVDELLASPLYGRRLADIWSGFLFPHNSDNRRITPAELTKWLEKEFNDNTPWDQLVSKLLTATGSADQNGAVVFYVANPTADKMTDSVTKLFLGVQLQCAQCHNHPFTGWKQTEYWGMAAFFTKVRPDNARKAGKTGASPSVSEEGKGKAKLPDTAKIVPAKFLQSEEPKLDSSAPYRPVLAKWLTAPHNPFFAKAMVNRTWGHFFGRGFVNPLDDMHEGNPASHPELMQQLSHQFVANSFDLKYLVRAVCNSQTYQRTSKPLDDNADDETLFSHMNIKSLSPEQLYDSLAQVVGAGGGNADGDRRKAAQSKRPQAGARDAFAAFFRLDENTDPVEYGSGIPHALRLMNSTQFNNGGALLSQALKAGSPAQIIEQLYLGTITRRPADAEMPRLLAHVTKTADARKAYGDILWALMNSSEFTLNH